MAVGSIYCGSWDFPRTAFAGPLTGSDKVIITRTPFRVSFFGEHGLHTTDTIPWRSGTLLSDRLVLLYLV